MLQLFKFKSVFIFAIFAILSFSQNSYSQKEKVSDKKPVVLKKDNGTLTHTPANYYSQSELEIISQMNQYKQPDNFSQDGDKILALQRKLENTNGSSITKQESVSIGKTIIPQSNSENISSGEIFSSDYMIAIASQVEQRAAGSGKIWVAAGHSSLDTGSGATPDTITLFYSINGGASFTKYVSVAFSPANKIGFDDLDMEIIENTSGTKYIYLVFGYYTNGYFGVRRIGYLVVSTPTLAVFGSTLSFPGQNTSSKYFNARITSDNARYPGVPYVTVVAMQDSTDGTDNYLMTKMCRVLSPYTLTPAFTYLPKSIYAPAPGFYDYSVSTDIAFYHNGVDSLIFLLSAYPGYNDKMYLYKAFNNSTVYPASSGVLNPTGDNLEYARIAANGGTNQTKLLVTYTDDYNNTGDYDQWYLSTFDAVNWSASTLEYTSLHKSRYGDVIGRRNADGSFSVTFLNSLNYINNVTSCRFNGNFDIDSYLHCTNTEYANSIANPKPAFRYVNGDSCINFWSYYYTLYNTTGCSAINFYLTVTSEGFYNEVSGEVPIYDTYTIVLAEQNPPYNHVDSALIYLDPQLLMNEIAFKTAPDGDYYFILKHFNTLETWSANPITISHDFINSYDFTSSDAQAFGNNMTLKGTRWCIYSGDVDHDGAIDLADLTIIDNDIYNFIFGQYLISDLNGDNFVDLADFTIADNNAFNFVSRITP